LKDKDALIIHHNVDGQSAHDNGLTWAKGHLHGEMDTKFFCPKEFVPGAAGGFKDPESRQACCILDKSIALMEIIYLARNCQKFESTKDDSFTNCFTGALEMVFWHLRACCVDLEFFEDKTERPCMSHIKKSLSTLHRTTPTGLATEWGKCTGHLLSDGTKITRLARLQGKMTVDRAACEKVEMLIVKYLLPRVHEAAQALYKDSELTKDARQYLNIVDKKGSQRAVDSFLKENGGITNDGEPCLGARRRLSGADAAGHIAVGGHKITRKAVQDNVPYGEPLCAHCEPNCPHTHLTSTGNVGDHD
jgi:hypothetical protein